MDVFPRSKKGHTKKISSFGFGLDGILYQSNANETPPPKKLIFFIKFCFQVAGNIGLINPLIFNHFGYGTYAQVAYNLLLVISKSLFSSRWLRTNTLVTTSMCCPICREVQWEDFKIEYFSHYLQPAPTKPTPPQEPKPFLQNELQDF